MTSMRQRLVDPGDETFLISGRVMAAGVVNIISQRKKMSL